MLYIWRAIARTDKHKFGALVYNGLYKNRCNLIDKQ